MARKAKKIQELTEIMNGHRIEDIEKIDVTILKECVCELSEISDPRDESFVRHALADIIMIVFFAVMAYADEWGEIEVFAKKKEKWLRKFLTLEHGIPTDDTYRIVLSKLNVKSIYRTLLGFFIRKITEIIAMSGEGEEEGIEKEKELISCDGKVSKSSKRNETEKEAKKPLNTLNAYSSEWGACIDQEFIDEKSNEIPALPILLNRLNLEGTIVTWDALNTQKETVKAVINRKTGKGDYVGALKGNHGNIFTDVKDYFNEETIDEFKNEYEDMKKDKSNTKDLKYTRTIEKEHSAIITREYFMETEIGWLHNKNEWAGLKSIGMEIKTTQKTGSSSAPIQETRYYINSVIKIEEFARAVRGHWGVENRLHWHLDYTFKDDENTTTKSNGAEALQMFKKLALFFLTLAQVLYPPRTSLKKIRYSLSLDFENEIEKIFTALNPDYVNETVSI